MLWGKASGACHHQDDLISSRMKREEHRDKEEGGGRSHRHGALPSSSAQAVPNGSLMRTSQIPTHRILPGMAALSLASQYLVSESCPRAGRNLAVTLLWPKGSQKPPFPTISVKKDARGEFHIITLRPLKDQRQTAPPSPQATANFRCQLVSEPRNAVLVSVIGSLVAQTPHCGRHNG